MTEQYWRSFAEHSGRSTGDYDVVAFGDNPALITELSALVVAGRKRATCSLARTYVHGSLPKAGDHFVVVDGGGVPLCICRTTEVEVKPLIEVDDRFAWDEGEGDRTRACWLDDHRTYFAREAAREGFVMHDNIEAVFERFAVVWPPALADAERSE